MSAIRSDRNRSTELRFASLLRESGITGWRRRKRLLGNPDFVFLRERLAVFVDGCFWHGCRWHCRMPKSRQSYWKPKIEHNRVRDKVVTAALRRAGWSVLRIWEHSLAKPEATLSKLQLALRMAQRKARKHHEYS
jgi:DNA mismatch endonuclease (patch repair protein)